MPAYREPGAVLGAAGREANRAWLCPREGDITVDGRELQKHTEQGRVTGAAMGTVAGQLLFKPFST